ncbi:outer membrane beta-barrel protein [Sphingomonas sp. JC676]|nr:outer membrane beta-barrel protein [Sphingomonas sp. JC676]
MSGQAWGSQVRAETFRIRGVNSASLFSRASLSRSGGVALLATAWAAVYAAPADAQTSGGGGRQIDVSVSNRLQYDSDVVLSDSRISGGRGKDDVSTSPTLDLDIYLPRATGSLYLRGNLGYVFYRKFTKLNRERINLEGGFDQRVLGDCIVHGSANYSRQLSDLGDVFTTVPVTGEFRNSQENREISADVGCGGGIGFRPSVAVSRSEVRNSAALRKFSDADTNSLTGQIGYSAPALGIVSVFGRYSDSKYINRSTPSGNDDGVRTYAAGVQLERNLGTRLNFTGSVNYSKVKPYLASVKEFSGVGFDLSAQYRGDFFQVGLTGSRAAEPSTLLFVSYDIQTSLGLTMTTELTPRLRWNGGFSYRRRAFASSPIFIAAPIRGTESLYSLNAGLSYQAGRRLRFSLDGGYTKRTSDTQLFNYDQKRISLTTSLSL